MPDADPTAIGRSVEQPDPRAGSRSLATELAERLWGVGADADPRAALHDAETALEAATAAGEDPVGAARLRTTIGHLLIRTLQPSRATRVLETAADVLEAAGDHAWLARCLGRLALLQLTTGAVDEGFATARRAAVLALQAGMPGVALVALGNVGAALVDLGDPLGAIEQLAEALNLADGAERRGDVALVLAHLSEAFHAVGDLAAAERYGELAVVTADDDTDAPARLVGRLVLANAYHARGEHEAAVATAIETEALSASTGVGLVRAQALMVRMAALRALGRPADAVAAADAVTARAGDESWLVLRSVRRERLLANLDSGDDDAVRADAGALIADTDTHARVRALAFESLAEVARRAGDAATEALQLRAALDATRAAHAEETKRRSLAIRSRAEITRAELDAAEHRRRTVQLQRALDTLEHDRANLLAADAHRSDLIASLERLADEDALTGLPNRRRLERALHDAPGYLPGESSFALIDVDHFKQVNDDYGHDVGDRVLARLARLLARGTRPTDLVSRVGGEEFAVLLGDRVEHTAQALERLRGVVAEEPWDEVAPGLRVTVSIGLVPLSPGETLVAAMRRADAPLYEAKRLGRDRVAVGA